VFRWIGWQWAIATLVFSAVRGHEATTQRHTKKPEDLPPTSDPYRILAKVWTLYAQSFVPWYGDFLQSAARHYGVPIRSVLDLACGTGLVARQMAPWAESVVGLDRSPAMLEQARAGTTAANVRYVQADFCTFQLDETFDAVVCASDSLNYVESTEQLAAVFGRVAAHLRPGGLFVFDILDHAAFAACTGRQVTVVAGEVSLDVYFCYDPEKRVEESRVVLGDIVERHRRIPLEREDVQKAAAAYGLEYVESFSLNRYFPFLRFVRRFYVLRKFVERKEPPAKE
jgi:SAM-dependent methyltransferase